MGEATSLSRTTPPAIVRSSLKSSPFKLHPSCRRAGALRTSGQPRTPRTMRQDSGRAAGRRATLLRGHARCRGHARPRGDPAGRPGGCQGRPHLSDHVHRRQQRRPAAGSGRSRTSDHRHLREGEARDRREPEMLGAVGSVEVEMPVSTGAAGRTAGSRPRISSSPYCERTMLAILRHGILVWSPWCSAVVTLTTPNCWCTGTRSRCCAGHARRLRYESTNRARFSTLT